MNPIKTNTPFRCDDRLPGVVSRRNLLKTLTTGFGYMAFAGLATRSALADAAADTTPGKSLLLPREPHFTPRAKRVIFLGMQGAPSPMDTFEYKPKLKEDDGKPGRVDSDRVVIGSPFEFKQHGQSGAWVSELFPHVSTKVDELTFLRGMWTDAPALHPQAWPAMHTGSPLFVRPSMGSWILYGLGTENQNLPGFVSIKPTLSIGGGQSYESAFLPSVFSATRIGDSKTPIEKCRVSNIANEHPTARSQRSQLDLLQAMNRDYLDRGHLDQQVEGVIESYELAFKMQVEVPDITDLSQESQSTFDLYGIGTDETDDFGRQCLLARRLAEAGVRFVEVCYDDWDHHGLLYSGLKKSCKATDQPIAALLTDLDQRGLLDDTLVLWGGEFGRTPDCPRPDGRDHNGKGWTMWMAGGGVKKGFSYGETDDYGVEALSGRMNYHDLHATMLHLLGLDHERLTYRYGGRDFRLTDVAGDVHKEIFA
ncbi:MAG: DUF1501 domain-containing protein [Verrucomicrobiae bacterium]|nr:DUF1501 domain-containing protein [Verrucomicrobiae bacterium]